MTSVSLSRLSAAALCVALAGCSDAPAEPVAAANIQRSVEIADQFQTRLQGELRQALQAGGPVGAIAVCAEVAPAIAEQVGADNDANVRRISLRPRNLSAEASGTLRDRLTALAAQPVDAQGRPALTNWVEGEGDSATHYTMRAVVMQDQPCAVCHGTAVAPDVRRAIAGRYPADQATGFRAGDLRGAILIALPQHRPANAGASQ